MQSVENRNATPTPDTGRGEPFPAGTTIARYRIVALIGSGAMGDVYRAHDKMLEREVALKVLPSQLVNDRERVRRFAQEARAASALSHPHIVTIHEVGHARPSANVLDIADRSAKRHSEVHYIAMEFVDGRTLGDELTAGVPLRRAVELLAQVAEGLGKAHAAGIIHRDLKPDNIIVAKEGYAKVVDFGLAKLIDGDRSWNPIGADSPTLRALTQLGEVLGTPGYMSPEQISGGVIDPRADVFSFGCILYEAITRNRPFEAESFVDTLYKILHEEPPSIGTIAPDTPPELQRVVSKCLAKNRDDRYQSIRDTAIDLREWLQQADAAPARRDRAQQLQIAILATILATLPILGWIFFGRRHALAVPQQTIHRLTTNGVSSIGSISPDGRYVVYVSSESAGQTVWLQQLETKSVLQLVPPSTGHYVSVTFSRDSNYVYYVRYDVNLMADLCRIPLIGGKPETLVHDIDTKPAFSPDGSHVAFVRDDFNKSTSTLLVANANGSSERALAAFRLPDRAFSPSWSGDGKHIVVTQSGKIVEVAWPDGATREITTRPKFESVRSVTWSERSTLIAAATTEDSSGHLRLWQIDSESGDAVPMTDDLSDLAQPSVSDDGKSIAAVQTLRQANIFAYDEHGVRPLTSGVAANGTGGISWLGDRVLYSSAVDGSSTLWASDPAKGAPSKLTEGGAEYRPIASPDGKSLLYSVSKNNQATIWKMKPDGSDQKQLTKGPRDVDFAISPDSTTLAWTSLDAKSQWSLWTMPLSGGTAHKIVSRPTLVQQIHFTPDGKTVIFTGYEGSMLRLYRVPVEGGAITQLTTKRSTDSSLSPDGATLACSYDFDNFHMSNLGLVPVAKGEITTVPLKGWHYRWAGNKLTFLHDENGVTNLYEFEDGKTKSLTNFTEGTIVDYAWNEAGNAAAITHEVDSSDVVVIRRK